MTHDPMCLAFDRPVSWEPEMCVCDLIAKVRTDTLAKCVKVLDDHHPMGTDPCELCAEWDWMRLELESLKEQP